MRSLLKLVLILFCVQRAEGRGLGPVSDQKKEAASPHMPLNEDGGGGEAPRPAAPAWIPAWIPARFPAWIPARFPARPRRSAPDSQCGLRSILLRVRNLGLGYDSDETVLFKYCSGTCPHVRSNHDLTLTNLLVSGVLPRPAPGELWHDTPCCRPTSHEDMAFLDNSHRWHKVEKLSAAGCSCVG